MTSFTDKEGRKWLLAINVGTAKRCKALTNVDIMNAIVIDKDGVSSKLIDELAVNPALMVDIISALCQEQIKSEDMDEFAFASIFDGDVIETAADALLEEIINFSQPAKRKMLALLYRRTKRIQEQTERKIDEILADPNTEKALDEQLSKLFTNSQESSN